MKRAVVRLAAAALAVFAFAAAPTAAHAAPVAPPPPPVTTSSPAAPSADPTTSSGPPDTLPAGADNGGMFSGFSASDTEAGVPNGVPVMSDSFDTTSDNGHMWDLGKKAEAAVTSMLFGLARLLIAFACWLLDWALRFGLAAAITAPIGDVATTYQNSVIDRVGLYGLALAIAGFMCGMQILLKSKAKGFGEAAMSLVIAAVAATALISPAAFTSNVIGSGANCGSGCKTGILGNTRDASLSIAALSMGNNGGTTAGPGAVENPMTKILISTFVRQPHEMIQYGVDFDDPKSPLHKCVPAYNNTINGTMANQWQQTQQNVMQQPPGTTGVPPGTMPYNTFPSNTWDYMSRFCDKSVGKFNGSPSVERMFAAGLVAFAALVMSLLIIIIAGGFLVAQLALGLLVIAFLFALIAGIVPGGGRAVLWRTCGQGIKALIGIFISIEFLAMFCLLIQAVMGSNNSGSLLVRFGIIDFLVIASLVFHRRLINAGKDMSFQISRRLERMNVGGSRGSFLVRPMSTWETRNRNGNNPFTDIRYGARSELRRVTSPVAAFAGAAGGALIGSRAAAARANRGRGGPGGPAGPGGAGPGGPRGGGPGAPQAPSPGARLATRMRRARIGRVALNTASAAATGTRVAARTGQVATAATLGAPVSWPRYYASARAQGSAGAQALRTRLNAVGTAAGQARASTTAYGTTYVANLRTAASAPGRAGAAGMRAAVPPVAAAAAAFSTPGTPPPPRPVSAASGPPVPGPRPIRTPGPAPAGGAAAIPATLPTATSAPPAGPIRTPGPTPAGGAAAIPATLPTATSAPAAGTASGSAGPPPPPARRGPRRATRPAGPPPPADPVLGADDDDEEDEG